MDTGLRIVIMAAVSDSGVIGDKGDIPWKLRGDLKRFKTTTTSYPVIMGRTTYESIVARLGKALPGRENIVLTRNPTFQALPGVIVVHSLTEALSLHTSGQVFIIGGAQVYREALPLAHMMFLTRVHANIQGDATFPEWNQHEWRLDALDNGAADEQNEYTHTFQVWTRTEKPFVETANARLEEQRTVMEQIQKDGVCPFCQENLAKYHKAPIIKQTQGWILTENQWPYENTRIQLLAITTRHKENLYDLSTDEWRELGSLFSWAQRNYRLASGGLVLRFGQASGSGATVQHLHAQLLSARITDKADPSYKPVRFRIG